MRSFIFVLIIVALTGCEKVYAQNYTFFVQRRGSVQGHYYAMNVDAKPGPAEIKAMVLAINDKMSSRWEFCARQSDKSLKNCVSGSAGTQDACRHAFMAISGLLKADTALEQIDICNGQTEAKR